MRRLSAEADVKEIPRHVTALIVAAGQGKRFGGAVSKQFLEVHGRPLLWHTMAALAACPAVDSLVVILPASGMAQRLAEIVAWRFDKFYTAVAGGAERHDSVMAGLAALPPETTLVAIHDGVRPLVTSGIITASITAAAESGAAIAAVPPKDTIKAVAGATVEKTLDRRHLVLVQTPQTFRVELIRSAYARAAADDLFSTDDAALVEAMGHPVRIVPGDYRNIKVTSPEDLVLVQAFLE